MPGTQTIEERPVAPRPERPAVPAREPASWRPFDDRTALYLLTAAVAAALAAILWFGRDTTFYNLDELMIIEFGEWDVGWLVQPFLAQLMAGTRIVYLIVLDLAGADYEAVRVVGAVVAVTPSVLFFFLARPRVGSAAALALTIPLLFCGAAWEYMLWPFQSISIGLALAFGLGAMIALARDSRGGDAAAAALLTLAVIPFGLGLAFVAAAGVGVLRRADRRRRIWIVAIPVAVYAAWWLWQVRFGDGEAEAASAILIPNYIANSLGAVGAALAGLTYDFGSAVGFNQPPVLDTRWGTPIALAGLAALAYRIRRGGPLHPMFWVALTVPIAYWASGALVVGEPPNFRFPGVSRYIFPSAVMVLCVAVWALDGRRLSRTAVLALFGVAAFSVPGNLAVMRNGGDYLREYTVAARAQLAMLELAGDRADPGFIPAYETPEVTEIKLLVGAGGYQRGAEKWGSIGYTEAELLAQPENIRHGADVVLAAALELEPSPIAPKAGPGPCARVEGGGGFTAFELLPGVSSLEAASGATLGVRRFASETPAEIGRLAPGEPAAVEIPRDEAQTPFVAVVEGGSPVKVCGASAA